MKMKRSLSYIMLNCYQKMIISQVIFKLKSSIVTIYQKWSGRLITKLLVQRIHYLIRRSEEHTSELQSRFDLVCRLLLEKKKKRKKAQYTRNVSRNTKQ